MSAGGKASPAPEQFIMLRKTKGQPAAAAGLRCAPPLLPWLSLSIFLSLSGFFLFSRGLAGGFPGGDKFFKRWAHFFGSDARAESEVFGVIRIDSSD